MKNLFLSILVISVFLIYKSKFPHLRLLYLCMLMQRKRQSTIKSREINEQELKTRKKCIDSSIETAIYTIRESVQ